MPAVDWATIARYVPEILLVVIFMGYAQLRDKAAAVERSERVVSSAAERKERDISWQQFLKEEREARVLWAGQAATQISTMTQLISTTNTLIVQHDTWERAQAERRRAGDHPGN